MGDRGVIRVLDRDGSGVELYTHWTGSTMHLALQRALAKEWRWNDASYLTRIIFCELVKGYEEEEAGFGISALNKSDDSGAVIVVDVPNQTVAPQKGWKSYSFKEFIKEEFN